MSNKIKNIYRGVDARHVDEQYEAYEALIAKLRQQIKSLKDEREDLHNEITAIKLAHAQEIARLEAIVLGL